MKTNDFSYDEFLKSYDEKITVCRLYNQIPHSKVIKFVRIQKNQFDLSEDFDRLENLKLVWYQNASGKSVGWSDVDARHIELKNENDEKAYRSEDKEKISKLIEDFKVNGLKKDLEIISVTDSKLDKEIIIDGVHRAIAIYRLYQKEPDVIKQLLSSQHGIYLINFQSPAAALFFPYDFLSFYWQKTEK
jgi:hypothetical protein